MCEGIGGCRKRNKIVVRDVSNGCRVNKGGEGDNGKGFKGINGILRGNG